MKALSPLSRIGLRLVIAGLIAHVLCPGGIAAPAPRQVLGPASGPQLFIDDFLIAESQGVKRVVQSPRRLAQPILDSGRFGTTQPYMSVLRDPASDRFRMWYNKGSQIWMTESSDGIKWSDPRAVWPLPRAYGASLIDDGARDPDKSRRYKLANWRSTREFDETPKDDSGMYVGFSPNGIDWTDPVGGPVVKSWAEKVGVRSPYGVGDIVDVYFDPIQGCYAAAVKVQAMASDNFIPGPKANAYIRRLVAVTLSRDFIHWEKPMRIVIPDERDEGLIEFYGMGGIHARGGLLIGFVRVLRDDLPHETGSAVEGIGYSALATSRDGIHWIRDREPFLDRNPASGTWDRAMTWAGAVQAVGDELFIYYGGYARGHKIAPATERQIGLARLPRDRYVARAAGNTAGLLRTIPVVLNGDVLTLNAKIDGELSVRVLDEQGRSIAGFEESRPLRGDAMSHRVVWQGSLGSLRDRMIRLEFKFRDAQLFAFEVK